MAISVPDLSADQKLVYDGIKEWLAGRRSPTLTVGGFGGTGKSTVVSVLANELVPMGPIAFCAFTGKASSVLARKLKEAGVLTASRISAKMPLGPTPYCGTIHGLIYRPCDACMEEEEHKHTLRGPACRAEGAVVPPRQHCMRDPSVTGCCAGEGRCDCECVVCSPPEGGEEKCLACDPPPPVKRDGPCSQCHGARYFRRTKVDRDYRLIVVDEASMVDDSMLGDLLKFDVPILAVGDHGQLPPVKGVGGLMKHPDLRLEKIHRQAEGNPIIRLSKAIREKGYINPRLADGDRIRILSKDDLDEWIGEVFPRRFAAGGREALGAALIAWTNRSRCALNEKVRAALGFDDQPPKKGETMICLKNEAPIYNGMRGILSYDAEMVGTDANPRWKSEVNFVEDGLTAEPIMSHAQFFAEKTVDYDRCRELGIPWRQLGQLYDFGFAMTCHKAQGSQFDEVGVLVDGLRAMSDNDRRAWLYTAVTRASERVVIFQ